MMIALIFISSVFSHSPLVCLRRRSIRFEFSCLSGSQLGPLVCTGLLGIPNLFPNNYWLPEEIAFNSLVVRAMVWLSHMHRQANRSQSLPKPPLAPGYRVRRTFLTQQPNQDTLIWVRLQSIAVFRAARQGDGEPGHGIIPPDSFSPTQEPTLFGDPQILLSPSISHPLDSTSLSCTSLLSHGQTRLDRCGCHRGRRLLRHTYDHMAVGPLHTGQ
jgi:hypothetical protein